MHKVYFLGKLSGVNRKEAAAIVRQAGGTVAGKLAADVDLIIVGDENLLKQNWNLWNDQLDDETREAFEKGKLSILSETQFWETFSDQTGDLPHTLYSPSMLATLTGLPIPTLRRLQRDRFIVPVRQIYRLCYFDKDVILPLKIIQNMLSAGLSLAKALDRLRKISWHTQESLTAVQIKGKDLIFTSQEGWIDHNGQKRLPLQEENDFQEENSFSESPSFDPLKILDGIFQPVSDTNDPATLCAAACELESTGNLSGATDLYRAALAAGGADPQINFQLAEVLYRQGELSAACERYFSAIELDEHFVEARANLGCVLAELGRDDLAAAAFRGALNIHPDYVEVRFHLGMLLKRQNRLDEAEEQFQIFRELMPEYREMERFAEA